MNLAPVTYIKHTDSLLLKAAADFHLAGLVDDLGFGEFLPSNGLLEHLLPAFCAPLSGLCDNVLELLCGPSHFLNQTRIDVYLSYTPAGTSCLNLDHWSQGIRSDSFQAYDWVRYMSCLFCIRDRRYHDLTSECDDACFPSLTGLWASLLWEWEALQPEDSPFV